MSDERPARERGDETWEAARLLLSWQTEQRLLACPVFGVGWTATEAPAGPVQTTRLGGLPADLVRVDAARDLWLDRRALARWWPLIVNDALATWPEDEVDALWEQPVGITVLEDDGAQAALDALTEGREARLAVTWVAGLEPFEIADPLLDDRQDPDERLSWALRFPDVVLDALCVRGDLVNRIESVHARYTRPFEGEPPCVALGARLPDGPDLCPGELGGEQVRALRGCADGAYDDVLEAAAAIEPEAPSTETLAVILATATAMFEGGTPPGDVSGYLDTAMFDLPPAEALPREQLRLTAEIHNLWGLADRYRDDPGAEPVPLLNEALRRAELSEAPATLRQQILYNRGYARLGRTAVPDPELAQRPLTPGESTVRGMRFPVPAPPAIGSLWSDALDDFRAAAELDPADLTSWSQVGMTAMLLGGAVPGLNRKARIGFLREAIAAYDRLLAAGPEATQAEPARQNQARCRELLAKIEGLGLMARMLGGHQSLLLARAEPEGG